ncbi:MAG: hypothetical protein FWE71_04120 [Nocardioidaceae bacterium]|nr:hypothetical protein [Nocardioidaceae bacterium]MCL2612621.1 hypothetical protein [Nocardioidaceae bacterium]
MSQPAPVAAPDAAFVDTPALLTRWHLVAVATVIAFGLVSGVLQILSWQSDGRAAAETQQLVRVQGIKSSLLRADALATTGYLTAGLEPTAKKQEYADTVNGALAEIADAAEAQPADRAALAALNQQVETYTTDVAQAEVYNRQGLPLGIAYQTAASTQLRDDAIPIVDALVKANAQRSQEAMGGQHPWWLLLVGILAIGVLVLVNQQMARAFRRRINGGLLVAAAIVALTTLVTAIAAFAHAHGNNQTEDGAYREAVAAATARTAADSAKADESLRLINRGSGQSYETDWSRQSKQVDANAPSADLAGWRTYVERHRQVVALDEDNRWRQAVVLATTGDASGSTAPLDRFDQRMQGDVRSAAQKATGDLSSGRTLELLLGILTVLLGVVAAVMVSSGIAARRKEFL